MVSNIKNICNWLLSFCKKYKNDFNNKLLLSEISEDQRELELDKRRQQFIFNLENVRHLPPERWRGEWYLKLMRLINWLNTKKDKTEFAYINFYFYDDPDNPSHDHASCDFCVRHFDNNTTSGSWFETTESCGIDRTLEQNCEGLYKNICKWIFAKGTPHEEQKITVNNAGDLIVASTGRTIIDYPGFPTSYEELELKMIISGF